MRRLIAVTEGEYSDFCVRCLFERQEDADAAVAAGAGDATMELSLFAADEKPKKLVLWGARATVFPDGRREEPVAWSYSVWDFESDSRAHVGRPTVEARRGGIDGRLTISAWSANRAASLKAVADRYAKELAQLAEPAQPIGETT